MESFAHDALRAHPSAVTISEALADLQAGPRTSLHLDDVGAEYSLAGEAFSCSLEVALSSGDEVLAARGAALLSARSATEVQIMGDWGFVGRG